MSAALVLLAILISCREMSEFIHDPEAGMNGGFEISKEGKPVNWLLYTQETVQSGNFEILSDNSISHSGNRSLKIDVKECDPRGGNLSPGFATQIPATPGQNYQISFWIMNDGTEFLVKAGGVGAKTGETKTLIRSQESSSSWEFYEYSIHVSNDFEEMRIEVNCLSPGTFWIDDINVQMR